MTKLVNASPEEIREYFKGNGIRWVDTFDHNNVPDEIIIEFKDRIFRGDSFSRADAIINMMVKHKRQLPQELFELIDSKFGCTRFYHIDKVYDFVGYLSALSKEELNKIGYNAICTLERVPNVSLEFAKLVLELDIDPRYKHDTLEKILANPEHEISPDVYDYILDYFKTNYYSYYLTAKSYSKGSVESMVFTLEEYLSLVKPNNMVCFFDYGYSKFTPDEVLESIYNTPEIIQIVVDKLLKFIETGNVSPYTKSEWRVTQTLIGGHPDFEKIRNGLATDTELYTSNNISWDDADAAIEANKMRQDVLEVVLLRLDAPLWFTDKYQSKILQLMVRNSIEHSNNQNVSEFLLNRVLQSQHGKFNHF